MFGAAVGLLRLPDFYSRLHASGMLDTTGLLLFVIAVSTFCLWQNFSVNTVFLVMKLIFIAVFIFITSPTATHAIVDAGIRAGMKPWEKNKMEE
jgi:multicomponent Na+:H+ antiporter subunit G